MMAAEGSFPVLLVEDDEVDIESVQREFKKVKIAVDLHIARNGVEALDKLYGRNGEQKLFPPPRAILLDINMPKMNGIEFLKTLRQDPEFKHTSVYILTMSYNTRDKVATHGLNLAGYIVKPLECEDVLRVYWSLVGGASPA
jgi:CheY-like chemotaxis protein